MENEHCGKLTLTVRLVRSFQHRNIKHLVYHDVSPDQTVTEFISLVNEDIQKRPGLPAPFRNFQKFDTMKISHQPFGAKTTDPVINLDNDDELMLKPTQTLTESNVGIRVVIAETRNLPRKGHNCGNISLPKLGVMGFVFHTVIIAEHLLFPWTESIASSSVNETEVSYFNLEDYRAYQNHPSLVW